ncbi:MAG: chromosomal replication initiator protein DnaA [Bacteroidales bacterium]|nr:chromosomal replication initiator protein DnaA [Bacteroidales bacterium]
MEHKHTLIWEDCLRIFRDNLGDSAHYRTWFAPIKPVKLEDHTLTIQVPSPFFCEWLEEHYVDLLRSTIRRVLGPEGRLEYSVVMDTTNPYTVTAQSGYKQETRNQPTAMPVPPKDHLPDPFIIPGLKKIKINSQLNENYSFDNFIEGDCNRLARSAGYAIAENPGKTAFNPLFLHSPIGLGKTHLMNAIGLQTKMNHPDLTVLYVSAELFTQQFIDACRNNTTNDFTHFYQLIDVLLIDDIHKLAKKDKTQDAFFQIFNHLHQSGKQLVISSDKPPVELLGIEQRLLSRFKWGLAADLQVPDVETRIAILKKKIHANGVEMPQDVIEYIAYSISTNVREMEGVLNSLLAQSILNKKTITMELARKMIDQIVHNSVKEISIDYIQKVICDHFELPVEKIHSNTRRREIVIARQLAMFFAKKHTKASLASIGTQCGKRDHATVLHACKTINNLIETDKSFKSMVDELDKKIKS